MKFSSGTGCRRASERLWWWCWLPGRAGAAGTSRLFCASHEAAGNRRRRRRRGCGEPAAPAGPRRPVLAMEAGSGVRRGDTAPRTLPEPCGVSGAREEVTLLPSLAPPY